MLARPPSDSANIATARPYLVFLYMRSRRRSRVVPDRRYDATCPTLHRLEGAPAGPHVRPHAADLKLGEGRVGGGNQYGNAASPLLIPRQANRVVQWAAA